MFPGKRLEPAVLCNGEPLVLFFVCPVHIFILTYRSGNAMKVTNDMSVLRKFPVLVSPRTVRRTIQRILCKIGDFERHSSQNL